MLALTLLGVEVAQKNLLAKIKRSTGGDELRGNGAVFAMRPRPREVRAEHLHNRIIECAYNGNRRRLRACYLVISYIRFRVRFRGRKVVQSGGYGIGYGMRYGIRVRISAMFGRKRFGKRWGMGYGIRYGM